MFYLAGVGLGLFLTLLLLSKKEKTPADKVLACWLFVISLHLALFAFHRLNLYPQLWGIDQPLPLMHAPLLYLYTIALIRNRLGLKMLISHLLLPASFFIYLIPFFLLPTEQKVFVYAHEGAGYETFLAIKSACIPLSGIMYVLLSSLALRKHRRSIVSQFSSTEKINLIWLQYLTIGMAAMWMVVMSGNDDSIFAATVIFVFFIGYFGIRQGHIFHSAYAQSGNGAIHLSPEQTHATDNGDLQRSKYERSGLSADASDAIHRRLTAHILNDKPYRDSDLSLAQLARQLDTPANYLSQVINEREGKNFYDYINTLRIDEFRRVAASPESRRLTLFALAQECGFNSKSSFNRHFRKVTGKSPSEYMQAVD